jgi:hypothetical protein
MRPGQCIGREKPPGLGPHIAEGMPHAAGNPNERASLHLNPLVPIEEGEGSLQDIMRFLLQVMDMRRRAASGGNRTDEERQAIALAVGFERDLVSQDPERFPTLRGQIADLLLLARGGGPASGGGTADRAGLRSLKTRE